MRAFIIILTLFLSPFLRGQGINKAYIDKWIKLADSSFAVDSVRVYFVNGLYLTSFDTLELAKQLKQIKADRIACIGYSKIKECGYQPGKGTIFINSIKQQNSNDIEQNLTAARKLFTDKYSSFSQHIYNDAKNPVLMIDNFMIHHSLVDDALKKLNIQELYSVDINPFPVPLVIFGQNAKNGLVQVLTKKKALQ